jgi:hypothetical protein
MSQSIRHFAAIRAHRTMLIVQLAKLSQPVARSAIETAIAAYDAELEGAPVREQRVSQPVSRQVAAWKAHRTMCVAKLRGSRGKVRAELKAKIASYDAQIAA